MSRISGLLFAQMGFDAVVLDRIGFVPKEQRQLNQSLEFVWDTTDNNEEWSNLLAHVLDRVMLLYTAPTGFDFESDLFFEDQPVSDENLDRRSAALVEELRIRRRYWRNPEQMMVLFGMVPLSTPLFFFITIFFES